MRTDSYRASIRFFQVSFRLISATAKQDGGPDGPCFGRSEKPAVNASHDDQKDHKRLPDAHQGPYFFLPRHGFRTGRSQRRVQLDHQNDDADIGQR